jgi:hypothetical protein
MMLFLLIFILSLVAQVFLPWWIIALLAFGLAFWKGLSARNSFVAGFVGIALGWLGYSLLIHVQNAGILTERIAHVLPLHNAVLLILITVIIGGLVGGMAALAGYYCRKAILTG